MVKQDESEAQEVHPLAKQSCCVTNAYAELQAAEFARESDGYKATKHQKFVGTGYFDLMAQVGCGCGWSGGSVYPLISGATITCTAHVP